MYRKQLLHLLAMSNRDFSCMFVPAIPTMDSMPSPRSNLRLNAWSRSKRLSRSSRVLTPNVRARNLAGMGYELWEHKYNAKTYSWQKWSYICPGNWQCREWEVQPAPEPVSTAWIWQTALDLWCRPITRTTLKGALVCLCHICLDLQSTTHAASIDIYKLLTQTYLVNLVNSSKNCFSNRV